MSSNTALGCLVFVCLLAPRAAAARCDELARAPRVTSEATRWGDAIAHAIAAAEARLSSKPHPAFVWLDAPTSGAWYCHDHDTVYATRGLVDYAWLGRAADGADFLGFALAHELAHRRFDRDDGALATTCPEIDVAREAAADRRATFLLALARDPTTGRGFSPFNLARRDALATFFAAELGWAPRCPALTARVDAVAAAITHIGWLGRAYDTALVLGLHGGSDDDVKALAALDAALNVAPDGARWDAVPELKLTRAVLHLERAARAGWCPDDLARAPLTPSPCALRCVPILPGHPLLATTDALGDRSARPIDRHLELATVARLLSEARALGATPVRTAGIRACAAYLDRDPRTARAALAEVASGATTPALRARLRDADALIALQAIVLEEPGPIASPAWLDALHDRTRALAPDSTAALAVRAWLDRPTAPRPLEVARAPDLAGWVSLTPCAPSTTFAGLALSPTCAEVRSTRTRIREATPLAPAGSMRAWATYCRLALRGVSDDGDDLYTAQCPVWDAHDASWLVFARGDVTTRTLRIESSP